MCRQKPVVRGISTVFTCFTLHIAARHRREDMCHAAYPLSGDLYLFCNRLRHRAKVLHWDGTGLCIYMKRLEKGRFASLWRDADRGELELTESELRLFLEGCSLVGRVAWSPTRLSEKDLYVEHAP